MPPLLAEYGAVLGADTDQSTVPTGYAFRSQTEVQRFQQRAASASGVVGNLQQLWRCFSPGGGVSGPGRHYQAPLFVVALTDEAAPE